MKSYPNYRIAVEIVIVHEGKVLLAKRADHVQAGVAVWSVPVGKVKYEEIPVEGMYREAKEETNLDVELLRELDVRAVAFQHGGEEIYRLVYTYLVKPRGDVIGSFALNLEHTESVWVTKEELLSGRYPVAHENLLNLLLLVL